jgi:hypothetical protein
MFLRFVYAVGNVGFIGALGIILLGHMVTIPTAMAIAEISTNQKVEGGGEYFIISRSFGLTIGSAIGISLYLSQAISVAFYIVAMGISFGPFMCFFMMFTMNTLVAPSYTGSLVQVLQIPGISGKDNNMILLDFERGSTEQSSQIIENYGLMRCDDHDICVLSTSAKGFGVMDEIHIWIDIDQIYNAQMMIVLSYILLGNNDWKKGHAKVFVTLPEDKYHEMKVTFEELIFSGRIPISRSNVNFLKGEDRNALIQKHSKDADLLMIRFNEKTYQSEPSENAGDLNLMANVLYVNSNSEKKFGMEKS